MGYLAAILPPFGSIILALSFEASISDIRLSRVLGDPGNMGSSTPMGDWSRSFSHSMGNGPDSTL